MIIVKDGNNLLNMIKLGMSPMMREYAILIYKFRGQGQGQILKCAGMLWFVLPLFFLTP